MPASHVITSSLTITCLTVMAILSAGTSALSAANLPAFELYDEILLQNVRNGFVDYDQLAADTRFDAFIEQLGSTDIAPPETDDERLALYINAYNAFTIQGIVSGYSPESWWSRRTFFKRQKYLLGGEEISLEAIEHDRIIQIGDPRIHFALVCASLSCPRLSANAYQSATIDVQLHDAAKRFINDTTRNRFDLERRIAFLSKIFEWYAEDFEVAGGSIQRYLARFIDDAQVQDSLRRDEFELRYLEYDWNLNGRFSRKD
ncbi:MAG: DUF547 domain-containing protein [Gammaproteobacteria bacterium]|nr:DUF547 domain-containing protein [Gammaproteobacteria bacterium]